MKYPFVLQHSEEDCGAACLATIAKYYGRNYTINRMRDFIGTGQLGTTLFGIRKGAEKLGFKAQAGRATPELLKHINQVPLPMIIHWKGRHWVVLYGKKRHQYIVADPTVGIRYLTLSELMAGWSDGVMLILEIEDIQSLPESDRISGFGRFLQRILPYKAVVIEIVFINIAIGLLSLAIPFLIQILTDDILIRQDTNFLTKIAIAVILINLFNSIFELVQFNLMAHVIQRLELGLILDFTRQMLRLPLSYYEARRSGEIVSRLQDIQHINQLITNLIANVPSQFFIALVSLSLMLFYSEKLTLISVILSCLILLSTIAVFPGLKKKTQFLMIAEAENYGFLVENFKGVMTLKTINGVVPVWEDLQRRFGNLAFLKLQRIQLGIVNEVLARLVSNLSAISLLWIGSKLVINQQLTIGQLLAFNTMNGYINQFLVTIVAFTNELTSVQVAVRRVIEVIDAKPETQEQKAWVKFNDSSDIICQNLNFSYPGRGNLLDNLSITIPGGKVTAIIGESGCGKSTLIKLIAGLYSVETGNIRYGVFNQIDIALDCLRQQLILVPQDTHFWSRSIIENFRLTDSQIDFTEIVNACQIACADTFISELPEKYSTILGEFGANISGGQKQRLAIARAIAAHSTILILDESTSNLDPILEAQVLKNIFHYRQGKTTILISHRPQVISQADYLIFLDKGQLILAGNPQELAQIPGQHLEFLSL
jgi:ATP-binding cassette, subfamily C, bacterial